MLYTKDKNGAQIFFDHKIDEHQFFTKCSTCDKEIGKSYKQFFDDIEEGFDPRAYAHFCSKNCEQRYADQIKDMVNKGLHHEKKTPHKYETKQTNPSLSSNDFESTVYELVERLEKIEKYGLKKHLVQHQELQEQIWDLQAKMEKPE